MAARPARHDLPLFRLPGAGTPAASLGGWTLHFLVLAVLLVVLGFANYYFDVEVILQSPWPLLRKLWLPLVSC